jgi:uncharacterized membrane protein
MSKRKPENRPAQKPTQQDSRSNQITVTQAYSGPLPPSAELSGYNEIVPGAAERIILMAEKSQDHQIYMERTAIAAQKRESLVGQIFALVISLSAFGTAVLMAVMGHPTVAGVIGGSTVVSLAVAFITGRKAGQ